MYVYRARDAVDDGYLVDLRLNGVVPVRSLVAYATRGVWDRWTRRVGNVVDISVLARVVDMAAQRIAQVSSDEWFIELISGELWAAKNEEGTWTLMRPEEY